MRKSHEQRLVTKEHIVMHTHLNFALYSSALTINFLNLVSQNCYCNIVLLNPSLLLDMLTFKTEVLYLDSNVPPGY